MTTATIKKQVDSYLPMLTTKQQVLVLEMIKSFLQVDESAKRINSKQYNNEINDAVERINQGNFISHKEALKEISKW